MKVMFDGYWIWLLSEEKPNYTITGKYLFFSEDKNKLIGIATSEIENHGFHRAKVNENLLEGQTEHVLCLYYKDDSRKRELAERNRQEYEVKYRHWKTDKATLKGQYSKEFLAKLPESEREDFTREKEIIEFKDEKGNVILRQITRVDENSLMQIHGIGPAYSEYLEKSGIRNVTQLSRITDLVKLAKRSGIPLSLLRILRLKAKSFLENRIYQVAPFGLANDKLIFFDIETDMAPSERVWLIGLQIDGKFIQLYADNWKQEKRILRKFIEILQDNPGYDLISFSTTNFDHRVTLNALKRHRLSTEPLTSRHHDDLGILFRRCFIFPIKSYALKDLGSLLEYKFKYPELDGLMVASSYHRHVEEKEPLDPKILEYNQDDVKVLPHLIDKLTSGKFDTEKIPERLNRKSSEENEIAVTGGEIHQRVMELRERTGWGRLRIARELGISENTVGNWLYPSKGAQYHRDWERKHRRRKKKMA